MSEKLWRKAATVLGVIACAASASMLAQTPADGDKIPITTSSQEARKLYLDGRDLLEKLRATDARRLFEQAVAKDPEFRARRTSGSPIHREPTANSSMRPPMRSRLPPRSAKGSAISSWRSTRD